MHAKKKKEKGYPIWWESHRGWLIAHKLFEPEAYPTCVSSKLCEFILLFFTLLKIHRWQHQSLLWATPRRGKRYQRTPKGTMKSFCHWEPLWKINNEIHEIKPHLRVRSPPARAAWFVLLISSLCSQCCSRCSQCCSCCSQCWKCCSSSLFHITNKTADASESRHMHMWRNTPYQCLFQKSIS